MLPTAPPKNAIGTNTDVSTTVIPTIAPLICFIAFTVASYGGSFSSTISRSTFSTTTIASSTRMPIASTIPNIVSTLIEKPAASIAPNVPSSATGTTSVGISVARKFCMKRNITANTSTPASTSVVTTLLIDTRTNDAVSYGIWYLTPGGKNFASSSIVARTRFSVATALEPGASLMPMPVAVLPFTNDG